MDFTLFQKKMRQEGLSEVVIDTFRYYFQQLVAGTTGVINEQQISPIETNELPDYASVQSHLDLGKEALQNTAVIKLNGGLGTSMGLQEAKSLLEVKQNLCFLEIVAKQIQSIRKEYNTEIPLLLMNSFNTQSSMDVLEKHNIDTWSFLQHKFPKVCQQNFTPVVYQENPNNEWNPPGHGDIYTALVTSGMLEKLLNHNIHYAFVSNIDNLGATIDPAILGYFAHNRLPFMMEVTRRTPMDRKGGHLARSQKGQLLLREAAQCPEEEIALFQDIERYKFFNTNNLWIDLRRLQELLKKNNNILGLPMIRNSKLANPRDLNSPRVYQLETAMGAAICSFNDSTAIVVDRDRFAPVKKCNDLLLLWSDYFTLNKNFTITQNPQSNPDILIELDDRFYSHIDQLKQRFPYGAPSLVNCKKLCLKGDIRFGKDIKVCGEVEIENFEEKPLLIPDNAMLT